MPCTDCTRIQIELGCLKELMGGWFTVVNDKLSGLEDGQKLLISRFDKQDETSAKGDKDKVASLAVDGNIVQNGSLFAATFPVESAVNEDENAIIPISTYNSLTKPEPIAASGNVILNTRVDQSQKMTQDFSAAELLDDLQISCSLVEPQPSSHLCSQYIIKNANIDEQQSGIKAEPLLQQPTDKEAHLSISSGLVGLQNSSHVNVHNILNDSDAAPYLDESFMQAENLTVTNKRNVAEKLQSNSVETVLKTQRRISKRYGGKKVVYTDTEAKRSKTEENDIAINKETYMLCSCRTSNRNKCNRSRSSKGEKHFQCGHFKKKSSQKFHLVTHARFHTDEKPFQCNYCEKKFSRKFCLVDHERVHTGEKPFQCNYCKKKFSQKSHLVNHVRLHTGQTPYKCNYCEKKFSQKSNLVIHMRLHTGETPYKCNYCEKKFSQRSNLVSHMRLHTGESPYKCNYCEKKFARKDRLVNHVRSHTCGKPYQCSYCEERFSQKAHLVTHEDLQHYR